MIFKGSQIDNDEIRIVKSLSKEDVSSPIVLITDYFWKPEKRILVYT